MGSAQDRADPAVARTTPRSSVQSRQPADVGQPAYRSASVGAAEPVDVQRGELVETRIDVGDLALSEAVDDVVK